MFNVMISN